MTDRNANRKGYKKTPVGWIPEEWACLRVGQVSALKTGFPFESEKYVSTSEGVRLLRGDNVVQGRIRWDNAVCWSHSNTEELSEYKLTEQDVVVAMDRPWVGAGLKIALITADDIPSFLVQRVARLRSSRLALQKYIYAHLRSHRFESYVKREQQEGGVPHISANQITDFLIPLPAISEQNTITEILSIWEETIEQTRALIAAAKRRKKALMQQLLTGKKRLPICVREKWQDHQLGDLFSERVESRYNHLPLLAITRERGIIPATEVDKKDSSPEDKSLYKRIVPGDIGYNTMRMWQGVSAVSAYEGIVSPAYTICTPGPKADASFAGYLFKYEPVIYVFWRHSQGLVDDTLSLKYHNFARIRLLFPPISEQRAIAAVLTAADEEIKFLEAKGDALENQKKGLMQKLLTGEVRMKSVISHTEE
jgi:type I restriction enzyme S subunit